CFTVFHRFALLRFFAARRADAIPVWRRFGAGMMLSAIRTCGFAISAEAQKRVGYGNKPIHATRITHLL
ncbi:hypothetical protein, partial [Escherichia coli]|uniref:hypothetical protein n=1 Tax=Escherichia coli TaxID=562 RepID=UPI001BFC7E76